MPRRLDIVCRQRALRRLAAMHRDQFADLLAAERLRAGLPAEPRGAAECGTRSGYNAHLRRGEPTCQPCRDAEADYMRRYKADRKATG